jgi:hypothetical protein
LEINEQLLPNKEEAYDPDKRFRSNHSIQKEAIEEIRHREKQSKQERKTEKQRKKPIG